VGHRMATAYLNHVYGRHLEGGMLRLPSSHSLRIEVRIVGRSLRLGGAVVLGSAVTDGRVVLARLIGVLVLFDRLLLTLRHASPSREKPLEDRSTQGSDGSTDMGSGREREDHAAYLWLRYG
jgi:hypothetical protein